MVFLHRQPLAMQGLVLPWLLAFWALVSPAAASASDETVTACYVVKLTEHQEVEPVTVDNSVSYSLLTTSIEVSKMSHILSRQSHKPVLSKCLLTLRVISRLPNRHNVLPLRVPARREVPLMLLLLR